MQSLHSGRYISLVLGRLPPLPGAKRVLVARERVPVAIVKRTGRNRSGSIRADRALAGEAAPDPRRRIAARSWLSKLERDRFLREATPEFTEQRFGLNAPTFALQDPDALQPNPRGFTFELAQVAL